MPRAAKIPDVKFNLKNISDLDKPTLIYLFFRYKGKRLKYSTGEKVKPRLWDGHQAKYTRKHPEYVEVNSRLNTLKEITIQIFKDFDFGNLAIDEFKKEIKIRTGQISLEPEKKNPSLFEFIDQYIKDKIKEGGEPKRSTWKKFITVQNHLINYAKEKDIQLNYNNIDWHFRKDFVNWLYSEPRKHAINNAAKIFEVIKQFMQESFKLRYHENKTFNEKGFGVKRVKTNNKVRLDFDELNQLRFLRIESKMLDKVRDLFIVGCYTGLRFSDWHKVNSKNIKIKEGVELLEILTKKTNQRVYIPCLPELKTILKKYNYQLPTISAQKFNDGIKEVCRLASIDTKFLRIYSEGGTVDNERIEKWKKVSSHAARRSFASNFYNLEIPPFILMQITGHTTEKQFFEYIDVDQEKLALKFAKIADMNAKKRKLKVVS